MWLMITGGLGMMILATVRYYKENTENAEVPNLVPNVEQNGQEKTVSTIELVPPRIG